MQWMRLENEEYEPRQLDFVNGLPMVRPQRLKVSMTDGVQHAKSLQELVDYLRTYDKDDDHQ